jgi:hypothetical protein
MRMTGDENNDSTGSVGTLIGSTAGGISGLHAVPPDPELLIAPSTDDQFNTIKATLAPFACWRVEDFRFAFDSSFVDPGAREDFELLAKLIASHPGSLCSVFGHADPVGDDEYNKKLSGRRAKSVYAVLTRKVGYWEELYQSPLGGDDWSKHAIQNSLMALGYQPGAGPATTDPATRDAVKQFQQDKGLTVDGVPGKQTRQVLFPLYMDYLCGAEFKLTPEDFLGGGQDSNGKGDFQGCGEFNPVLMFSKEEKKELDKPENQAARNAENAPNRRVIIYLYRPGTRIELSRWPCPRYNEGGAGCQKRFWSDAPVRRSFQEQRREYRRTHDTFACRTYDRIAVRSPCEAGLKSFRIRLLDPMAQPIAYAPFEVSAGAHQTSGRADAAGWMAMRDLHVPGAIEVAWGFRPLKEDTTPEFVFHRKVYMEVDLPDEQESADRRLQNLGYYLGETFADRVKLFQRAYGRPETGALKDIKEDLWFYHDKSLPRPLPNSEPDRPLEPEV